MYAIFLLIREKNQARAKKKPRPANTATRPLQRQAVGDQG